MQRLCQLFVRLKLNELWVGKGNIKLEEVNRLFLGYHLPGYPEAAASQEVLHRQVGFNGLGR
jgi:hypothetical protein